MSHEDILAIVISVGGVIIPMLTAIFAWLWRHSSRLTATEVETRELEKRMDRLETMIMSALIRIEEKIDRKVDR